MLPISLLATMKYDFQCFWNHILVERLINAMLVVLLPKLWFWIENRDWHKCFWMSSWGSPLLGPKKLQNQQFYIIDWIRKKTPGRCCQSRYLLLWSTIECFWNHILVERLINAMLVVLLPKLWFWIENRDWHKCFWMSSWGSPLLGPKKLQNQQFYIIDWIRKKTPGRCCQSRYLLPWWLRCTIGSLGTLRKCYVSSPLGSQPFRQRSGKQLGQARGLFPVGCLPHFWGSKSSGLAELFSAKNLRARALAERLWAQGDY